MKYGQIKECIFQHPQDDYVDAYYIETYTYNDATRGYDKIGEASSPRFTSYEEAVAWMKEIDDEDKI